MSPEEKALLEALERQTPLRDAAEKSADAEVWGEYCQVLSSWEAEHPEWDAPIRFPASRSSSVRKKWAGGLAALVATAAMGLWILVPWTSVFQSNTTTAERATPVSPHSEPHQTLPSPSTPPTTLANQPPSEWDAPDTAIAATQDVLYHIYASYRDVSIADQKLHRTLRSATDASTSHESVAGNLDDRFF